MGYAAEIFGIFYSQWDYRMVNISRILKFLSWHGFDEFGSNDPNPRPNPTIYVYIACLASDKKTWERVNEHFKTTLDTAHVPEATPTEFKLTNFIYTIEMIIELSMIDWEMTQYYWRSL